MPQPEFGHALAAALEGFRFDPAKKDGKPVANIIKFEQRFNNYQLADEPGDPVLSLEKRNPDRILQLKDLDAAPKPRSQRPPEFPISMPAEVKEGEAVVECLIDKDGRVRLPRIKSATADAFGYAAVQAASAWWFEPPLAKGKPVVVRAQTPFTFTSKPPARKAAAPRQN